MRPTAIISYSETEYTNPSQLIIIQFSRWMQCEDIVGGFGVTMEHLNIQPRVISLTKLNIPTQKGVPKLRHNFKPPNGKKNSQKGANK